MCGEYRRSINPKTPEEENIIYNINPTTTGGKLISELKVSVIILLPEKFLMAIQLAKQIDIIEEISVANTET